MSAVETKVEEEKVADEEELKAVEGEAEESASKKKKNKKKNKNKTKGEILINHMSAYSSY